MEFVPLLAMGLLVFTLINFVRYLVNGDKNGIVTTLSVWLAGVLVVLLVSQTDFAASITVANQNLSDLNFWSLVFVGLTISSIGNFSNEILKAVDNSQSAAKPHLLD